MLRRTVRQEAISARQPEALAELRGFAREALSHAKLDDYERGLILLCIDEVLTAIIENARERHSDEEIRLVVDINDVRVRIMIEDTENRFENNLEWWFSSHPRNVEFG